MSADDKEYLRKHGIHKLLDGLAKEIIEKKPENPQQFVITWLKGKNSEEQLGVQKIAKETVAGWIKEGKDIILVDVSGGGEGDKIKGSVSISAEKVVATAGDLSAQWKDKVAVVVYGTGDATAQAGIALQRAMGTTAVYILSCTLEQWAASYPALTTTAGST